MKVKEYSEQLEWTPSSASTMENLLSEQFDRCLTADALNDIENTIHQVNFSSSVVFSLSNRAEILVGKSNRRTTSSICLVTQSIRTSLSTFRKRSRERLLFSL